MWLAAQLKGYVLRFRSAVIGALLIVLCGACSATDGTTESIDDTAESATSTIPAVAGSIGPNEWSIIAMTPDEQHILVSTLFGGVASGCTRWEGWEIDESSDQVTIEALLWKQHAPGFCTGEGITEIIEVNLDAPLGDRTLTGCGRTSCLAGKPLGWLSPYLAVAATAEGNSAVTDGRRLVGFGATGDVLWERESWPIEFLGASSDAVVIYDAGQTMALDPSTGVEVWSSSGAPHVVTDHLLFQCPADDSALALFDAETWDELWTANERCGLAVIGEESVTIVADGAVSEDRSQLLLFDTASGELSVRRVLEDGIEDQVPGFQGIAGAGDVVVVGGFQANLVVLGRGGEELLRGPTGLGTPIGSADGVAILAGHRRIFAIDPSTAEGVWELNGIAPETVAVSGGALWALHPRDGTISRLDPKTGEAMWESPIGITHPFAIASSEVATYVATPLAVIALDTATGEQLWWTYIPFQRPEPG